MVAWILTLHTPEYPQGREVVLIANDLTHFMGSFSPMEDHLFCQASELARQRKIPRVTIFICHVIFYFLK